ncbi:MAG: hypothetical protein AAFR51_12635 [Pseudomonadota bacterium]
MRAAILLTFVLLSGCTSSIEKVQAMRAQAPDWYEARKVEFRGEGYPDLSSVPELQAGYDPLLKLTLSEEETLAALAMFNSDPRAQASTESAEAILAWAADVRRAVEGRLPAPDFMTDAEVDALKARFDVPRGRL